jgi:hypothetical protein
VLLLAVLGPILARTVEPLRATLTTRLRWPDLTQR